MRCISVLSRPYSWDLMGSLWDLNTLGTPRHCCKSSVSHSNGLYGIFSVKVGASVSVKVGHLSTTKADEAMAHCIEESDEAVVVRNIGPLFTYKADQNLLIKSLILLIKMPNLKKWTYVLGYLCVDRPSRLFTEHHCVLCLGWYPPPL